MRRSIAAAAYDLLHRLMAAAFSSGTRAAAASGDNPDLRPWEPPFDPLQPSTPISYPITDLQTLESRAYFDSFHFPFNKCSVPLAGGGGGGGQELPPRRRLLVCHDMMGGYRDDALVQGGSNPDAYAIWHWRLFDVFVYFSHYLVTLPPPCWTNTAHAHGVKVLGTFIIEWNEGKEICKTMLSTKNSARMYAERLAELASALGFDGWLLNFEVELDVQLIDNLKEFVDHLNTYMHSLVPGSLIIWYDAVTIDGRLIWQNQLSNKNKPFFDICDGIFVNYSWMESDVKQSALVAGNRKFDVYMGIDVFGRNTYGGGQWNTDVALDLLNKDDVSAAIFAPGWVYETKQGPDFQSAQNCWWDLVEKSWGVAQRYPFLLPFNSNFNQGHGYHVYGDGLPIVDGPWNNISCQSYQPVIHYTVDSCESALRTFINFQDPPYSGGASFTMQGMLRPDTVLTTQLFNGDVPLEARPVLLSYSVKSDEASAVGLSFEISSSVDDIARVFLTNNISSILSVQEIRTTYNSIIQAERVTTTEVPANSSWLLYKANLTLGGHTLTGINAVSMLRKVEGSTEGSFTYNASLGHVRLQYTEQNTEYPPKEAWDVECQHITWSSESNAAKCVSLELKWQLLVASGLSFLQYIIFVEQLKASSNSDNSRTYIGVAKVQAFYISDLYVDDGVTSLKFIVQACGYDGSSQEIQECPSSTVDC